MSVEKNTGKSIIENIGTVGWDEVIRYVEFTAKKSFDENGVYHKYLQDFAETVSVLTMFTDYFSNGSNNNESKTDNDLLNEILGIRFSPEWEAICNVVGDKVDYFHYYVDCEIEEMKKPLGDLSKAFHAVTDFVENINTVLKNVDADKLNALNLDELSAALDSLQDYKDKQTKR